MISAKSKSAAAIVMVLLLTVCLSSCAEKSAQVNDEKPGLEEIVEKLYDKVDVPPYDTVKLDQTNFEFFAFVPYEDGLSAVAADALVNITPHSLVVIRTENGSGAELAKKVVEKADPNKWLCVGSEAVNVAYTDHYVVLIMSEKVTADAIAENFKSMAKELDNMDAALLTAGNSRYDG